MASRWRRPTTSTRPKESLWNSRSQGVGGAIARVHDRLFGHRGLSCSFFLGGVIAASILGSGLGAFGFRPVVRRGQSLLPDPGIDLARSHGRQAGDGDSRHRSAGSSPDLASTLCPQLHARSRALAAAQGFRLRRGILGRPARLGDPGLRGPGSSFSSSSRSPIDATFDSEMSSAAPSS